MPNVLRHAQCTTSCPMYYVVANVLRRVQCTASYPMYYVVSIVQHRVQCTASYPIYYIMSNVLRRVQSTKSYPIYYVVKANRLERVISRWFLTITEPRRSYHGKTIRDVYTTAKNKFLVMLNPVFIPFHLI